MAAWKRVFWTVFGLALPVLLAAQPASSSSSVDETSPETPQANPARTAPLQVGPVLNIQEIETAAEQIPGPVPDAPRVQVRLTQNNYFQVAGSDYVSVQYVTHMAQQAGEYGSRLVPLPNSLPLPILVELVSADKAGFDTPFLIRPQPDGDVHILIRWSEDTRFSEVCQALMSGYLVRCAIWRFGRPAATEVPDWMELGAGLGLEVELRPALIDEIVLNSRQESPWSLERIFSLKGSESADSPVARRQCFWLLRFLENQSSDREYFSRLMAGFLKNLPPYHLLVSAFPDKLPDEQTTEMWWAVGYEMAVRARQTPFYSLDESVRLIKECATLTAEINGADVRAMVHELYGYRGNPLMKKAALQRVREIKLQLQRVNPVYHNSLLSLGVVLEAWLALPAPEQGGVFEPGEDDQAYFNALKIFTADYRAAQLLDLEIKGLLNW